MASAGLSLSINIHVNLTNRSTWMLMRGARELNTRQSRQGARGRNLRSDVRILRSAWPVGMRGMFRQVVANRVPSLPSLRGDRPTLVRMRLLAARDQSNEFGLPVQWLDQGRHSPSEI
jgi:hypothetical protein